MSRFSSNRQSKSTHGSNYITEKLLEMYDVEGLKNGTIPLKFTTLDHDQWEDLGIKAKLLSKKYEKGYFCRGRNSINMVTY